jgi:hypothetical protein
VFNSVFKKEITHKTPPLKRTKIWKKTRSPPLPAIPTKNRFEVLQPEETGLSQLQDHPQSITAKEPGIQNTILEKIRRKERRNAKQSKQADHVPGGNITHPRENKGHTVKHPPPPPTPPRKPTIPQEQPTQPVNLKDLLPSTKSPRDQAQNGQPTSHSPAKGNRPPPINIALQDPKDTVALMQDILKIRNFHIKRIHAGKHVLYLQNLSKYKKAIEILITTNTAFYTYTPKSQKQHTYLLKELDNSFTETESST